MIPSPGFSLYDVSLDPAGGIRQMPLNMGDYAVPHAISFQSTMSTISKVYRPSDEGLKHSLENARLMRNDPMVMECVEMRQRACALFDWHVEPGDKNDPRQQECAEHLQTMLENIPRFLQYRENLLHATWYGRYGVQHKWGWKRVGGRMRMTVKEWLPVNGDKIVFRFDDGLGQYRPDQVGIRIGFSYPGWHAASNKWEKKIEHDTLGNENIGRVQQETVPGHGDKIQATDFGLAYFLDTWERPLLALHKHQIEDGEWEEPTNAGRVHGKGLRSVLYWAWLQKQEALALLMEYLERSAFGFNVWYYPQHNPQAKEAIQEAALRQSESGGSRNVIFFPLPQDETAPLNRVEHIEPGMGGASELKSIIHEYFGHQVKRYCLGQTLTSEASATGLGSNLAEVQLGTFMGIVRYDAQLLEETITTDLLDLLIQYNYPEYAEAGFRFRIDTEVPDSEARIEAIQKAYAMGLRIPAQALRDILGVAAPEDDEEVLDITTQQQAMQPQQMSMFGGPEGNGNGQVHTPNAEAIENEAYAPNPRDNYGDRERAIRSSDERPEEGNGRVQDIARMLQKEFSFNKRRAG